jgi:hypothetical protein
VKVQIRFDEVVKTLVELAPHSRDASRIARGLASAARTQWVGFARELRSTGRDYVQGISQPLEIRPGVMQITLSGRLPNMVEHGWDGPVDLRETIIPNARNRRVSAKGHRYAVIPFRHGTPGTSGRNVGRPMPRPIHNVAKALSPTLSDPKRGGTFRGHPSPGNAVYRLSEGLAQVGMKRVSTEARRLLVDKQRPWHSTSIFSGMIRQEKTYEAATQSQYKTFRVITENPDAQTDSRKWQHPGIAAHGFIAKVQSSLSDQIDNLLPSLIR